MLSKICVVFTVVWAYCFWNLEPIGYQLATSATRLLRYGEKREHQILLPILSFKMLATIYFFYLSLFVCLYFIFFNFPFLLEIKKVGFQFIKPIFLVLFLIKRASKSFLRFNSFSQDVTIKVHRKSIPLPTLYWSSISTSESYHFDVMQWFSCWRSCQNYGVG